MVAFKTLLFKVCLNWNLQRAFDVKSAKSAQFKFQSTFDPWSLTLNATRYKLFSLENLQTRSYDMMQYFDLKCTDITCIPATGSQESHTFW
jgi:hypothetical protein